MKILIVGAGGIGGFFGAKLHQAGADITYLLREKRQKLIQQQGLVIETPKASFTIHPKTVLANQLEPVYDLIILACKAFDLSDSLESIAKASSKGLILPFLNGLTHLDTLDHQFGKDRVMGGVAHIAATISESGSVKQLTELCSFTIGPRTPAQESLSQEFFALCKKADFDSFYKENIEQTLWDKWVFLATLAGMTTICRGSIGDIAATPYGKDLSKRMFAESCAIAAGCGYAIAEPSQASSQEILTKEGSPFTASMLRDLLAGKRDEHQHILGDLIGFADLKSIDCPLLKVAYTHMAVESKNRL
ncbi:2-dehydropantoate 2-reductase [Polynucleobacter sp. MWH-Berg-3C6]|uniref:2-dehydropantoate 2-reductase n=1 Tax=Polynucleobacter sp. MWH-Berg-3C6 TaxID=1855882 RepID=UPI001C0C4423|nr:2-dehydropantoate 2-reductase [Polynucleobacter sp. MWH-Berg-3C6]MBU3549970.1 2-dehydropantoate 2-reductase [Polynucleobacter sp. MWH-Berg-3C6]